MASGAASSTTPALLRGPIELYGTLPKSRKSC